MSDQAAFLQALCFVENCHKLSKFLVTRSKLDLLGLGDAFQAKVKAVVSKIFWGTAPRPRSSLARQFFTNVKRINLSPWEGLRKTSSRLRMCGLMIVAVNQRSLLKPIHTCTQMAIALGSRGVPGLKKWGEGATLG